MKSNKKIFEENNKELKDKVTAVNYNTKSTMQNATKKSVPKAEKNTNLNKFNDLKESVNKNDKSNNLNVLYFSSII